MAGTCPHLHSIIGIHFRRTHHGNTHAKYHSVSKTLHYTSLRSPAPNITSSCFYRVILQEIRWKQLVRIRPPNSFPNDFDVLARFCQLTGKWLPIPCFAFFCASSWFCWHVFPSHHQNANKRAPAMLIKPRSIQDILLFLTIHYVFHPFELSGLWRLWGESDLITCWIPLEITLVGSCPYKS